MPARALELEALLQLPRLADRDGTVLAETAATEVARLQGRLAAMRAEVEWLWRPPLRPPPLADLDFDEVPDFLANAVMQKLHYLHSPRRDSAHFGSYTADGRLVALVSLSRLDVSGVLAALPTAIGADETLVVSRVFAFDWAPRNTISHLLARVERRLRAELPHIRCLLTYVNPNLGFDGTSYRAANWSLFGREVGTRYGYLDGDYITDREIACLARSERARVVYSVMPLAPLLLFARALGRRRAVRLAPRLVART